MNLYRVYFSRDDSVDVEAETEDEAELEAYEIKSNDCFRKEWRNPEVTDVELLEKNVE